jgi:hypothetical protein
VPWEGNFRYELVQQTTATTGPFLNCIEDVEPGASRTACSLVTGTNTTVALYGVTRCAAFKTTSGTLTTGAFKLDQTSKTFDCLIADLPASTAITFTKGANITSVTKIADSDTDLTYTSSAQGTLWLRIVTNATAVSGTSNQLSW